MNNSSVTRSKPNDVHAESVIWIASYPKSGNTWVQNVVRAAGKKYGFPEKDIDVYKMKREGRSPKVINGVRKRFHMTNPTVLKTHSNFVGSGNIHPELGLKTTGFIYVIRNPLDVLLSFINFSRIQYSNRKTDESYQQKLFIDLLGFKGLISFEEWRVTTLDMIPRKNLDHALSRYIELKTEIPNLNVAGGSWLNHAESWIKQEKNLPSTIFRYEELIESDRGFSRLKKIFRFTDDEINHAVKKVDEQSHDKQTEGKKIFHNMMTSYYYTNFFSRDMISHFLSTFDLELKRLGYSNLPIDAKK